MKEEKKRKKERKKARRRALRPWKGLTVWSLVLALGLTLGVPVSALAENPLAVFVPGQLWRAENPDENANYFTSAFESEEAALETGAGIARQVATEGIVLLSNENEALPLAAGSRVSCFSTSSVNLVMGGSGSGQVDTSSSDDLKTALQKEGFQVNPVLWDFYQNIPKKEMRPAEGYIPRASQLYEAPWEDYPQAVHDSFADYGDAAILILSRVGGEHGDIEYRSFNYLEPDANERELLEQLCRLREEGVFSRIIVLINAANALEMDFVREYAPDACLRVGALGRYGINATAQILSGSSNPSGRLVDTLCYDHFDNPVMANFAPVAYENAKEAGVPGNADTYQVYQEGIYVGYRYFETRYEDAVMGTGNAGDYDYADTVAYPFGYGLSYTDFRWSDMETEYDRQTDTFAVTVTVTNTGSVPGKETVQIYGRSPYTDYDRQMGVEKAAAILCGYGKTELLAPGQSQTLTVKVPRRELASFDTYGYGTYILEAGTYYLTAAPDAHSAVNHLLAARGYTPQNTGGTMTDPGDPALVYSWIQEQTDTQTYGISPSGGEITSRLGAADPNRYEGSGSTVTWLSRSDWTGTYPTEAARLELTEALTADLQNKRYDPSEVDMEQYTIPTTDADNGLTLYDMIGKDYDDPDWELLLDQLSFRETVEHIRDAFHGRRAVESVNAPGTRDENGPTGLNTSFIAGGAEGTAFSSADIMASTFNDPLIYEVGRIIGDDCLRAGVSALLGPGVNLHRSAYAGRNFEYFSEDPYLSGNMAAAHAGGVESMGVDTLLKHFALNDCETDRTGLGVWLNEQTAREIYLKCFQKAFEQADANGVMAAYSRWGATWSGANSDLLVGVLREEWGCDGWLISDHVLTTTVTVAGGLTGGLTTFDASYPVLLNFRQYENDPYIRTLMREACHRSLYAIANSAAMNGVGPETVIHHTHLWLPYAFAGASLLFWGLSAVFGRRWRQRSRQWKQQAEGKGSD